MAAIPVSETRSSINYPLLASHISSEPRLAIFRCFREARALDILRRQGEIILLQGQIDSVRAADRASGDPGRAAFDISMAALKGNPDRAPAKSQQWRMRKELGQMLVDYGTAILQYKQLGELPSVNKMDLTSLRGVLDSSDTVRFPANFEYSTWSDENEADLTSLTGQHEKLDALSRVIESHLLRWYHNMIGYRYRDRLQATDGISSPSLQLPITRYSESKLTATVNTISTMLASLLPIIPIFVLYFIQHPLARMAAISAFSLLFCIVLMAVAQPRRIDCFAATTAFAAVQVVYVGTTIGSTQGC